MSGLKSSQNMSTNILVSEGEDDVVLHTFVLHLYAISCKAPTRLSGKASTVPCSVLRFLLLEDNCARGTPSPSN